MRFRKMTPELLICLSCVFLSLQVSVLLAAQSPGEPPGGAPAFARYDTASEVTVNGTVEAVNEVTGRRGWNGTHLQLKTADGMLDVHAGPSWFLSRNKLQVVKGDQIQVTGSKIRFNDTDALLARTIKKGDSELTLRNAAGVPVWSRGRASQCHRRSSGDRVP